MRRLLAWSASLALAVPLALAPAHADAADPARSARIIIEGAPFTRHPIVRVIVAPDSYELPYVIEEIRISNDPTTTDGVLTNGQTTGEVTDWELTPGPDGLRTVYAQLRYGVEGWSSVAAATITLDQDPGTSVFFDIDDGMFHDSTTSAPEPDWHERSSEPADMISASALTFPPGSSDAGFSVADPNWSLAFYRKGGPISVGTHDVVAETNGTCTATCVTVSRSGDGCSGTGTFVIRDIVLTDDLERLDADYRLDCGVYGVMSGSIRYGSNRAIEAVDQTPERYQFSSAMVGEAPVDQLLSFSNIGTSSATFGRASIAGDDRADFSILSDACSGRTIPLEGMCSIAVRFAASANGNRFGNLILPDETARGSRKVRLLGTGLQRVGLNVHVDAPASGPGLATVSVTITPSTAPRPQIELDGLAFFGDMTEVVTSNPSARTFIRSTFVTPGTHRVDAFFQDGGFYVYPAAQSAVIDVPDSGLPWGQMQVGLGAVTRSRDVPVTTVPVSTDLPISAIALSNGGLIWTERPFSSLRHDWNLSAGDGTKTVYLKWKDATGRWSPVQSDTIVLDTVAPALTAPTWRVAAAGTALVGGAMPVRIAWTGTDATSGIARHSLSVQVDGGAWTAISTTLTTPAMTRNLAPGHTYRFAVRATDAAGNTSPWLYGPTFRLTGLQQTASAVTYAGTWANSTSTTWWGGTARASSAVGATAKVLFTGRQFTWIGLKAANRGKAQVFVNGVLTATVDLYNATQQGQRVVWGGVWGSSATRTITIKVLGTAGRPRVDVDGFFVGN